MSKYIAITGPDTEIVEQVPPADISGEALQKYEQNPEAYLNVRAKALRLKAQKMGPEYNVHVEDTWPPAGKKFAPETGDVIPKSSTEKYAAGEIPEEEYKAALTGELNEIVKVAKSAGLRVKLPEGPVNVTTAAGEITEVGGSLDGGTWEFQTDEKSLQSIANEIASLGAGLPLSDFWITSDNNIISPLSQENFLALAGAVQSHIANIQLKLRQKKNEIQNMDSAQIAALGDMEEFWNS